MGVAFSVNEGGDPLRDRQWAAEAMTFMEDERRRAAETPMFPLELPEIGSVRVYIKDEAAHPSGSLKHRLARALFTHGICNGEITRGTTIVEASSGSTAISEAWFAKKLGLRFIAVVPERTAPQKIAAIRWSGGEVVKARRGEDCCVRAFEVAGDCQGHFMNQFGRASEVTDWRSSNGIADSLCTQAIELTGAPPDWIVTGAGTGGTSATLGRYLRYKPYLAATSLLVVDTERSAYFKAYTTGDWTAVGQLSEVVEGIGRPRVESSFCPTVLDQMLSIPDTASVAGAHWLAERTGRQFGPSTGTDIVGSLLLAQSMTKRGRSGTIVTLACDPGERYAETIYSPRWLTSRGIDTSAWRDLPAKAAGFTHPNF